jgi:hypothetical protein
MRIIISGNDSQKFESVHAHARLYRMQCVVDETRSRGPQANIANVSMNHCLVLYRSCEPARGRRQAGMKYKSHMHAYALITSIVAVNM